MSGGLVDDLRQRLSDGRVVVVAGSGMTAASTGNARVASWKGLLDSGLEHAAKLPGVVKARVDAARSLLEAGDANSLILAAEIVTESLGGREGGEYGRWLRETVGALEVKDARVVSALAGLGAPIATTNYDGLIEEVCGWDRVTWRTPAGLQRALLGEDEVVAHLHGHWREPGSVILGVRSYEEIVHSSPAQALQHAITATTTLLFVGIGDGASDPNFGALRVWLRKTLPTSENRHYRLCLDGEVDGLANEHNGEAIVPVSYGADHSELAPFLERLASYTPSRSAAASPSPASPTESASGCAPMGLPPEPVRFGRDDELAQLVLAVTGRSPQPLLLLGPPGIGKTNLTLAALHDQNVASKFGERRWFIRCDEANSASDLMTQIAAALGLPLGGNLLASLQAFFGQAPALLALDNLETPWEADTLAVEETLGVIASTDVAMIASLRGQERPGTVRWANPTLLEPLNPAPGRQLFLSIADKKFDADGLDELIDEMGGVPLAIELLAHASEGEPDLAHLAGRWKQERIALLARRTADHKLLSVAASVDLSWNSQAMTDAARRLLSLLCELPNGAADEDLEQLLIGEAPAAAACLRRRGLAFDQGGRLRVLPPIRHHVTAAHPPDEADWRRVVSHYLQRSTELGELAGRPGGGQAVTTLIGEAANLNHMIIWALRDRVYPDAFRAARGFINAARFVGIDATALATEHVAAAMDSDDDHLLAGSYEVLGRIALARSDHGAARDAFELALPLYRQAGSVLGEANCIQSLGVIALRRSDNGAARDAFELALPLYRQVGDVLGEANCIRGFGDIALARSDHGAARDAYQQALPLYRQAGSVLGEANCIQSLGDIALAQSDNGAARDALEQALPLYQQVGDVLGEANCIQSLGDIALARSDHGAALEAFEQALPLYRQVGDVLGEANCIRGFGDIALAQSDHGAALEAYQQALALYSRIAEPYSIGVAHRLLARVAAKDNDRCRHATSAHEAWSSIDRQDLVDHILAEFPQCFPQ